MTEAEQWAEDLRRAADEVETVSPADLMRDEDLHERFCKLVHRYEVVGLVYSDIEDQVQYPPDWNNLAGAVENVPGSVLLCNMYGWVSQNRWMTGPLSVAHEKGWLAPALRRLADYVVTVTVKPGWGF